MDEDELELDLYWGPNGSGTRAASSVGISNPRPLMVKSRDAGGDGYMFQGPNGTVYMWSIPLNDVYQYTSPTALEQILTEMRKPAARGKVEMKLLSRTS